MLRNTAMSTDDAVVLFDVGAGQAKGSREFQEDRCTIVRPEQFPAETNEKLVFLAIYDGHGSGLVAEHASKRLHNLLSKRPEFEKGDYVAAIKGALADEDALLLESFKNDSTEPAISGSTAARRLTEAHKPETPSERRRIEAAGGEVTMRSGIARLGDLQYKTPVNETQDTGNMPRERRLSSSSSAVRGDFVSNEPFTSRRTLKSDGRYLLVIVSDGVSDRTDDVALIQHVMKLAMRGMRASEIAQEIATNSTRSAKSDNASCIVAMLDGQRS
ncbi:Protein phosphatase 2C [Penicillium angulare]|uniref:protein-serine/threonine phosphatase n=1 Tax=Penicillium angulare TaxID=116970 RepID=A0A9W9F6P4_9EURO|nr:Protein phosphatase 2C [Penicillium angulare]